MTRKHFQTLAESLRYRRPDDVTSVAWSQWRIDVSAVADVCAQYNGRFDRGRFNEAAGVN